MRHTSKTWAAAVCLAALMTAPSALAGYQTELANCYKNTDGSGRCNGSLLGFRNHSGANTHANFTRTSTSALYFNAALTSGTTTEYFNCTADAVTGAQWSKAMNHQGYFSIFWNAASAATSPSVPQPTATSDRAPNIARLFMDTSSLPNIVFSRIRGGKSVQR